MKVIVKGTLADIEHASWSKASPGLAALVSLLGTYKAKLMQSWDRCYEIVV